MMNLSGNVDVAYKPEEFYVQTRKCEPDAGADVVMNCERLRDENGHIIEHTVPTCCPCGDQRRVPSSCGNFFDKMMKGNTNTAHCLRFPESSVLVRGETPTAAMTKSDMEQLVQNRVNAMQRYKEKKKY